MDPLNRSRTTEVYAMRARYMTTLLISATLLLGLAWLAPPEDISAASPAGGTLDWQFYDFFNVRPGEYFDTRSATYGETPIGAECFTQSAIDNGICIPSDPTVPDLASYPFTIWSYKDEARARKQIFTPFRFSVTGVDILGYDLTEPIFLPVLNPSEPAGTYLDFDWVAVFVDTAAEAAMDAIGCANPGPGDGYYTWSTITLEMDLQQSKRIFGVVAADATAAQAWWDANTNSTCAGNPNSRGPVENDMWDWFLETGGGRQVNLTGTYDIMNAYGWFLDQVFLDISATVNPDGTTHVTIQHEAWGTTNLLNRFFYWGSTHYQDEYLDSTKAMGWQGWEPSAWYDDMTWSGTLNASDIDFDFTGILMYDFELFALPGPDGIYNTDRGDPGDPDDDFSVWAWRPHLHDAGYYEGHTVSELDRYIGVMEKEAAPGSPLYGQVRSNVFVPTTWDLFDGETLSFQFPTGNVNFYDPNLTPIGASGTSNDHVVISAPLFLQRTQPASYGNWDPVLKTWDIVGPTNIGPVGSPGNYPTEPGGAIYFAPEPGATIGLVTGSALLALLNRRRARRAASV